MFLRKGTSKNKVCLLYKIEEVVYYFYLSNVANKRLRFLFKITCFKNLKKLLIIVKLENKHT